MAVELGPRLAERARNNLAGWRGVSVVTVAFEAWEPAGQTFDLVFACNSFHWLDPAVRFPKAAAVLSRGGYLALLTTSVVIPGSADRFWWDVQDDWEAVGAQRLDPGRRLPELALDSSDEVRASGLFEEPVVARRSFELMLSAEDYARNLSTQSGVKQLAPAAQAKLLARVRRRVEAGGGMLIVHHLAVMTVARRID